MQDKVSIITPTYNSEAFISETITSVQNQTYPYWEMIIVDDASTDNTVEIIKQFVEKDNRIKFFVLDENQGPGNARQTALEQTTGRYISFLDSDDLWKTEKLEKQLAFLNQNKTGFSFSSYECIDENGEPIGKMVVAPKTLTYNMLFFGNFVGNLTGIYDSGKFGKIAISKIKKRQDWIMWLEILKQIRKAPSIQESLAYYRIRQNSVSSSKMRLLKYNYAVYRKYHKLSVVYSFCSMLVFLVMHFTYRRLFYKNKISA